MLVDECHRAGVTIETHCSIDTAEPLPSDGQSLPDSRYRVSGSQRDRPFRLACQSLVVATGALSIPSLGGSGIGYTIAEQFGLPVIDRRAGLVPLMFSEPVKPLCERLSGLAVDASVRCNGQNFRENILFTHRGLSGPAILQISNYWYPGDEIAVDLLPEIDAGQWLLNARTKGKALLKNLLQQILAKPLVNELQTLWWPDAATRPIAEFGTGKLQAIGQRLNHWVLKPSATEGYRTAEVTLGGVDTDAINSRTMEVKQHPGLYFIGEVLDVTGHLGGYNFQWAWASGYSAGQSV